MFGINFGGLGEKTAAANEKMAKNHAEDLEKFNEGGTEAKERKHTPGWKTFMAMFIAGTFTTESISAATATMTPEEVKTASEFMKASPERVQELETKFLALAEGQPMVSKGVENGQEKGFKNFKVDDNTSVLIEYKKDVNPDSTAHPVSFSIRTTEEKSKNKIIISDGIKSVATSKNSENFDGRVDHIKIIEPAKYGKDKNGNPYLITPERRIDYGFTEARNDDGETYVQLEGLTVSADQAKVVLSNAQHAFEESITEAANPQVAANN